MRVMSISRFTR